MKTIFFVLSLLLQRKASCFCPQPSTLWQVQLIPNGKPAASVIQAAAVKPEDGPLVADRLEAADDGRVLSRRNALATVASHAALSTFFSSPWIIRPPAASARTVSGPVSDVAVAAVGGGGDSERTALRRELLKALASEAPDSLVYAAIDALKAVDPMKSRSTVAREAALDGEWKLLWYNVDSFSPLLKLPSPLRPDSYQYFGSVAATEVGSGRVAQGLTGGVLGGNQLWLSSGAVSSTEDPSIIEINPPFRFQLGKRVGVDAGSKRTVVEAQNDADFRAVNARTLEAQSAPKNEYQQVYLEDGGRGSLRISTIIKGDPVIVGNVFVHQKL